MAHTASPAHTLAARLAALFAALPAVEAVALSGSQQSAAADPNSDIDLYVYMRADIPVAQREAIMAQAGGASRADVGMSYWGPGDEWIDATTGIHVDLIYFDVVWIEQQLQRVLHAHQPSLGYSTCFWRTVSQSRVFYDHQGWFERVQQQSHAPYPDELRRNIVRFNHAVLRGTISSYLAQIAKAARRQDRVSINHRVAALLASYFDILFALNRVLHPGEKRLVTLAAQECPRLPVEMAADITALLEAAGAAQADVVERAERLLDRLDDLLEQEGFSVSS